MEQNTLGILLSYYRTKYKISMEQVIDGICSTSTLHRIENGGREVDSLVGETLLGRIGKKANEFEMMLGDEDYACWQVRMRLLKAMKWKDYEEAKKEIEIYRNMSVELPDVHRQFYLYYEGIIALYENESTERIWKIFSEAFHCTKKELKPRQLYSPLEMNIALKLIHFRYPAWKNDYRKIIDQLLFVAQHYYTGEEKESMQAEIWMELIYLTEEQETGRVLMTYIDRAIDALANGRRMKYLGELHFRKARLIEECYHKTKEWSTQEVECKRECLMAYYVFEVMRKEKEQKETQEFCEEKLGWHITEQEKLFD